MRVAHIILANGNAGQIERMIRKLAHPEFDFYIHLDRKLDEEGFTHLARLPNAFFIENRIDVTRDGYSLLRTILAATSYVLNTGKDYHYINLLSGQDYPIKSAAYIYDFLNAHQRYSFVSYDEDHRTSWWKDFPPRYESYHLTEFNFWGKSKIQAILNAVLPKRKFPLKVKLYGGNKGAWWILRSDVAKYLVHKVENNLKLQKFLKWCRSADEFVVPTLLMNSSFKSSIVNNNFRYIDWTERRSDLENLLLADLDEFRQAEIWFAGKFDSRVDEAILTAIDHMNIGEKRLSVL
jgi:Core-2/I-Branching enzyme